MSGVTYEPIARGKNLLLFTGILLIIIGAVNTVLGLIVFVDSDVLNYFLNIGEWTPVHGIILLIEGCFVAFVGYTGIINREHPKEADLCKNLSAIYILWIIAGRILFWNIFSSAPSVGIHMIYQILVALIVPILYFIGAHKNQTGV